MNSVQKIAICLVAATGAALAPTETFAQVSRLGETFSLWSDGGARGSDIAFDSKNSVYLVVSAFGTVRGRYVNADGVALGTAFVIQANPYLAHFPRVAYSPDAAGGAGGFLVTWHASVGNGPTDVYSRIVSYTAGLGTESHLAASDSWWEAGAAVGYSTGSDEFLVVWQTGTADVRGVRVGANGIPIAPVNVAVSSEGERDPNVAYSPATNEFMVVYSGYNASFAFVRAQRVKAGTGEILGPSTPLTAASGTYITNVAYNSATGQYLAAWFQPSGGHLGRRLNADGSVHGDVIALATTFAAYDALGLAYNSTSGTFHTTSQGPTYENGGVELGPTGIPLAAPMELTAIGGPIGNFYPRVAAHTSRAEWTLSSAHNYAVTIAQRFGSGTGSSSPPPTTPSCSFTLNSAGTTVGPTGGTGYVTITASASSCAWTAGTNAAWLTPSPASGTGTYTWSFSVAPNGAVSSRTGSVSIGGRTFTVSQTGLSAAVHDVNGDALSDIIWHHQTTGEVISWYLNGSTVLGWNYLSISAMADTKWKVAGSGDINGDGHSDLVWQHEDGYLGAWMLKGPTVVGTTNLSINPVIDKDWKIRALGDLNGDGRADIIWRHDVTGGLIVWFMNGANVSSWSYLSIPSIPDLSWTIAGAGDINGDGKADIIWQNQSNGGLVGWLMNGATVMGYSYLSIPAISDLTWKVRGVGDVDGDKRADLVWQNTSSGELVVWRLNGFQVLSTSYLSVPRVPDTNWHVVGPG